MKSIKLVCADFGGGADGLTIGVANIRADVSDVSANRKRVLESLECFCAQGVNIAIFPEFCLTGCFWEDDRKCRAHMEAHSLENQLPFIDSSIRTSLDSTLRFVVLNILRRADPPRGDMFFNSTLVIGRNAAGAAVEGIYDKCFPAGIENRYVIGGRGRRLVLDTEWGRFGFLTCYDLCFPTLLTGYQSIDKVDAIVLNASWRGPAVRQYKGPRMTESNYYARLWNILIPAQAAVSQTWFIAANAVGRHEFSGDVYCGGSGIWAPSGIPLIQAGSDCEELLVLRHVSLAAECRRERSEFDYLADFEAQGLHLPVLPAAALASRS